MLNSEAITHGIRIHVNSRYSEEHSKPQENHWFFLYTITISNESQKTIQLLKRHWIITDGNGDIQEIQGQGVIGQQPIIEPGQSFQYTSACPLKTEFGSMQGHYTFINTLDDNKDSEFNAKIAPFTLSQAQIFH